VLPTDGDHPRRFWTTAGHRDLEEALIPDEVGVERRPQRITSILCSGHLSARLTDPGVIDGHDDGFLGWELLEQASAYLLEEQFGFDALSGIHAVVGAPVKRLSSAGTQQTGDVVIAESYQLCEQVSLEPLLHGVIQAVGGVGDQLLEAI